MNLSHLSVYYNHRSVINTTVQFFGQDSVTDVADRDMWDKTDFTVRDVFL